MNIHSLVLNELEKNLKNINNTYYNLYSKICFLYDFLNKKNENNYKLEILEVFYNLKEISELDINIESHLKESYKDKLINILFIYVWYKNMHENYADQLIFQKIENSYKNSSEYRTFKLNLPKIDEITNLQDMSFNKIVDNFDKKLNNNIEVITSEFFDFVELEFNDSMCKETEVYNSTREFIVRVCIDGGLFYSYNNSNNHILVKKGDIFLVNQFILSKVTFLTERCKILIFRIKSPFIFEILNKYFTKNTTTLITLYKIENILNEYKTAEKDIFLLKILSNIINHRDNTESYFDPPCCQDREFAEIIQYIDLNINKGITIKEIEKKYKVYNKILVNKFKKYLNISPSDYLIEQKLLRAALALKTTKYKINYISDMFSFGSANTFSITFKNKFGVTPLKYRNTK